MCAPSSACYCNIWLRLLRLLLLLLVIVYISTWVRWMFEYAIKYDKCYSSFVLFLLLLIFLLNGFCHVWSNNYQSIEAGDGSSGDLRSVSENALDMLAHLFPHRKRSVLELILRRCDLDLLKAIEQCRPAPSAFKPVSKPTTIVNAQIHYAHTFFLPHIVFVIVSFNLTHKNN